MPQLVQGNPYISVASNRPPRLLGQTHWILTACFSHQSAKLSQRHAVLDSWPWWEGMGLHNQIIQSSYFGNWCSGNRQEQSFFVLKESLWMVTKCTSSTFLLYSVAESQRRWNYLKENGRSDSMHMIVASDQASLGEKYAALCAACSCGEQIRDSGGHSLVILDDISSMVSQTIIQSQENDVLYLDSCV